MVVVFVIAAIAFILYVIAEKQTDCANELRYQSFVLADELRQPSDDLTRMVRTYVITGDPIYKQYFQEILNIRDGKKPRPVKYTYVYWDLVLANNRRPSPDGPAVALLELMRQAGFTEPELTVMEQAKVNSDALTVREFAAMALIESINPITDANRIKASHMLNDADYHQAKAGILRPINEFYRMVDERTQRGVLDVERKATLLSIIVTLFGVLLVFTCGIPTGRCTLYWVVKQTTCKDI